MDIKSSIVAILDNKEKIVGTGFVAGENLILTCAHVVEQASAGLNERVTIRFSNSLEAEATVDRQIFSSSYERDVALLRVNSLPQGITPLPLGNAAGSAGHDFYAYGYATVTDVQGIGARGKIVDIVENGRLVQLTSQEPDHGMSGGPVLDEQRCVVIGMVTKGKGVIGEDKSQRNIFTTFATSVEVIREGCSELRLTEICPYRSLDVFNEANAPFFFGREKVVQKLLDNLKRESRFLAVLGPSGSGKSSVIQAGLIPALRQGKVPGSQKWGLVTFRPANEPFDQLASKGFINPHAGLEDSVRTWLAEHPDQIRLVLIIDQFEETLVSTPAAVCQKFIAELALLLNASVPVTIILILRDDFYSLFLKSSTALIDWLERGLVNAPAVLGFDELQAMIVGPAKAAGLIFDDGLVDIIIAETCEIDHAKGLAHSTVLPLLEFSLTQLWETRVDGKLTRESYKNIGGTAGCFSRWADNIYYECAPNERKVVEQVFCSLIHLGDIKQKIPDVRQMVRIEDLSFIKPRETVNKVVEKLIRARLLSTRSEFETRQQYIEIIHEALLREWNLLGTWIDKFRHREQLAKERKKRNLLILGTTVGLSIIVSLTITLLQLNSALLRVQTLLARQSISQAESTSATRNSKQMISVLLGIRSMQLTPSGEASQILLNHTLARSVFSATLDGDVHSVAFSPNGEYALAAGGNTVLLIDANSAKEITKLTLGDLVYSVDFSPDSNYFLAGCRDKTVLLWDIKNAREMYRFLQDGSVYSVKFSPDGNYIAATGYQNILIWRKDTGENVARMHVNTAPINAIQFSPDGEYLVSGDKSTARVWEVATGAEAYRKKYAGQVNAVAFSPDGKYVVSGGDDFIARVWDARTGEDISQLIHAGVVTTIAFSPDGTRVVSGSRDAIARVWDAQTGKEITRIPHDSSVYVTAFSPTGNYVISGGGDATARIWDAQTGEEVARMTHDDLVYAAAFSPNGKYAISGSYDHTVRIWKTSTSAEIARVTHDDRVYTAAFSPDGKYAVSGGADNTARVWEIATGTEVARMLHDDTVYAAAFSGNGKYGISGGGHVIHEIEVASGKEIATLHQGSTVLTVAFSPDSRFIASSGDDFTIRIWDALTGLEVAQLEHPSRVYTVVFSPDSKYLASGSADGVARIWEIATSREVAHLTQGGDVFSAVFSPDGKYIISGDDAAAHVWDVLTGKEISRIVQGGFIYSVAVSPDGKYVVSGGPYASVWEALTGKEVVRFPSDGPVNSVSFSPDGQYLVVGDSQTASVWNISTGKLVAAMNHNNLVKTVAFSPDGHLVISGGADKTARVWPWQSEDLIANACASLPRNLTPSEWKSYFGDDPYQLICPTLPNELEPRSTH